MGKHLTLSERIKIECKLNNIIGIIDNLNDNINLDNKSNEFDNNCTDYDNYEEFEEYYTDKDDSEISLYIQKDNSSSV